MACAQRGLAPVTSISAYKIDGSATVDGIVITYMDGEFDEIGSPDAISTGTLISKLDITLGDTVKDLYLWTDAATAQVQGIYMTMKSSSRLAASNNRSLAQPTLKRSGSDLGSGILLAVTAATHRTTLDLAAISFAFLNRPVSTAMSVDMPAINIDSLQFEAKQTTDSSISVVSGSGRPRSCKGRHTGPSLIVVTQNYTADVNCTNRCRPPSNCQCSDFGNMPRLLDERHCQGNLWLAPEQGAAVHTNL